ncbi:FBX41 protein, partial [Amazona guildingii]|nr:FBX41 protein [Amazona guildingii]
SLSSRASSRAKAVSQSSGCYDSDSAEPCPTDDTADGHPYPTRDGGRGSGLRRQAIQNWHRQPYRNSTEGEEGDVSDVGSRTTESEAEGWEPEAPGSATSRPTGSCRLTVATDGCPASRTEGAGGKAGRLERGSPGHCSEVISPEILKMRAALFCIFTYLDTKTLLRAAEVCKDWKFVARHPAVWTRVLLENARVSSKFLAMLSQWCTQMHSLTLQNLKPRQRGKKESKEDYMKSTRGCLEAGLESLLKATGSNLLILRISHCPNVLTDRSLWLASCYCRALQAVTYRSSTDPVGHEVIWALGAGCRDIISLQVAPLHPCQQPTRFSNRCLQMIGRCWPHLRALGVGGAGCGVQGLASLARNCMRLQVLELDHVAEINQEVAAEVCREGLKGLEMLVLTSTPVTPKALLHFNSVCRNLKSIVVQVGIVDYFKEPHSPEAKKMFEEMVNKLQALRKRPGFSKILHIKVEGGC